MSPRPPLTAARRRRPATLRFVLAALVAALAVLATVAPSASALPSAPMRPPIGQDPPDLPDDPPEDPPEPEPEPEPDPEPPPPPDPRCDDAAGFPRPTGAVPPGYVYSPTTYDGTVVDPQPDDTFAADAPGHPSWVGQLQTRNNGGREEILVCAHVGTNVAVDALTPFATTGPGAHPATIAPRVLIIDGNGTTSSYETTTPGIESTLTPYRGSTDGREAFLQMWVPFTPNLREPGFVARVEIRGTAALPGGASQVMGADEVYVHLGPKPLWYGQNVDDAVGLAIDDGAIGERPEDPGADDLSALLGPLVAPAIDAGIEAQAPIEIPSDWEWSEDWHTVAFGAGGTIESLTTAVTGVGFDVENFNATEGRLVANITGTAYPRMKIRVRSVGVFSGTSGACDVYATVPFTAKVAFLLNVDDPGDRPEVDILFVQPTATLDSYGVSGKISGWWGPFPGTYSCSNLQGKIGAGIVDNLELRMEAMEGDEEMEAEIETAINDEVDLLDLQDGPLSTVSAQLPSGVGFQILSPHYTPTRPAGGIGGEMFASTDGLNLAAGLTAYDLGNGRSRFPFSYVPTSTRSPVAETFTRSRPGSGGPFDLGVVVNGATVNQLSRALSAGGYADGTGLLDLSTSVYGIPTTVRPSVAPMYLPNAPAGWPTPATLNLSVPSVRIAFAGPEVASVVADVRAGLDVRIEGNRLDPIIAGADVRARFLRLRADVNQVAESAIAIPVVETQIVQRLGSIVAPITIPDLSNGVGTTVHVDNLTAATVGGGHLGLFVDVQPGWAATPPPMAVTTFTPSAPGGPPASFTTVVAPTGLPGTDPYRVHWTVKDSSGAIVYQSTAADGEAALTTTLPASGLPPTIDECDGTKTVAVTTTVIVRRGFNERTETVSGFYSWPGEMPAHPPQSCYEEPEPTEPEPEDPPIPPMCRVKPWLCEDL